MEKELKGKIMHSCSTLVFMEMSRKETSSMDLSLGGQFWAEMIYSQIMSLRLLLRLLVGTE